MDRGLLAGLFDDAINRAAGGEHDAIATWSSDDGRWVDVTWDAINLAYPHTASPDAALAGIPTPAYVELQEWAENSHVTFSHGAHDTAELADFVVACTERLWTGQPEG